MNKRILGLSLALMLGLGVVGCGDTQEEQPQQPQQEEQYIEEEQPQQEEYEYKQEEEYVEEQPQEKEEIKDEDVSDYYIQNRQQTDLEKAKEYVDNWLVENELDHAFTTAIDEKNNRLLIGCKASTENVANWINDSSWSEWVAIFQKATLMFHQELNVNVGMFMFTTDLDDVYLSVYNGEIMYNVEDEINK